MSLLKTTSPSKQPSFLTQCRKLYASGVYVLENKESKRFQVCYSKNMLRHFTTIILPSLFSNLRIAKHFRANKLTVGVLESFNGNISLLELKLRTNYYIDEYLRLGYKLYDKNKAHPINPKITIDLETVQTLSSQFHYRAVVNLSRKGFNKTVLGVFKDIIEAENFVNTYYNNNIYNLVYANNVETKAYMSYNYKKTIKLDKFTSNV